MAYGVMVPTQMAAQDVNSFVRKAVSASNVENGNIVILTGKSATAGESEVFTAVVPSTANGLTGVWMAAEPEVVLTASKFKGIDPDVRNFRNEAGDIFTVYKPQLGDLVTLSADCLAGTYIAGTTTHVNCADGSGLKPIWGNSQTASVFSMKLLGVTYFSIGTGAIDNQRISSYLFEIVGL